MRRKRGSLADELASLMDTRPADPMVEDEAMDDDYDDAHATLLAPADLTLAPTSSARMRGMALDLSSLSRKYVGHMTSRANIEEHDSYDDDSHENHGEVEENDEDLTSHEVEDSEEINEGMDEGGEEDEVDNEYANDTSFNDDNHDDNHQDLDDMVGDMLYAQWSAAQEQESGLLAQLKRSQVDEVCVAQQARRERLAFLQLLQLRMQLQPALEAAAQWPAAADVAAASDGNNKDANLWGSSAELRCAATAACDEAVALLRDLCAVREALSRDLLSDANFNRSNDVAGNDGDRGTGAPKSNLSARALAALSSDESVWWGILEVSQRPVWAWVEHVVDNFGIGETGGSGGVAAKFRAVRQGALTQASHLLAQLPFGSDARDAACHQSSARVLGGNTAALVQRGSSGAYGSTDKDMDGANGSVRHTAAEVYEDSAFYHALLKELLEDGGSGSVVGGASVPKLKHVKRPTNNRVSKGRRLSFKVQPKLQNFMFPEITERPVVLAELFASVFGQRIGDGTAAAKEHAPTPRPLAVATSANMRTREPLSEPVVNAAILFGCRSVPAVT